MSVTLPFSRSFSEKVAFPMGSFALSKPLSESKSKMLKVSVLGLGTVKVNTSFHLGAKLRSITLLLKE